MSIQFPITLVVADDPSAHEIFLTKSSVSLPDLSKTVIDLVKSSENCAKLMAGITKNGESKAAPVVTKLAVHWSSVGRDENFPKRTVLSSSNTQAALRLMELGGGKDLLVVQVEVLDPKNPKGKEKDKDVNKE